MNLKDTMEQVTKGTWHAEYNHIVARENNGAIVCTADGVNDSVVVAPIDHADSVSRKEEIRANVALIAHWNEHGPNLLKALRTGCALIDNKPELKELRSRMLNAIAEAEEGI